MLALGQDVDRTGRLAEEALARIAEVTGGVPRSINVLCDMALVYGFGGDQPIIDVALVDQVLADRRDFGVLGGLSTRQ